MAGIKLQVCSFKNSINQYLYLSCFLGSGCQIFKVKYLRTVLKFSFCSSCYQKIVTKYNILKKLQEQEKM